MQFHGLNIEKEKLTVKVEEQGKVIEELKRSENMKTKKMQKYAKYFTENDENKSIDIKKMTEENYKFKKFLDEKVKMKENESANRIKDNGEDIEDWRKRYQGTLKDSYIFYMLLDRYIEQNSKKDQLITALTKETQLLADKDLQIWNLKKEFQEKEKKLAQVLVDLSVTRAKDKVVMQSMGDDQEKFTRPCCYSTMDLKELKKQMKELGGESSLMKERIHKLEKDVVNSGKIANFMRAKLKDMIFKNRGFDDAMQELTDETTELIILNEDFLKLLDDRSKILDNCPLEKDERNRLNPIENAKKRKASFFRRILKKKN